MSFRLSRIGVLFVVTAAVACGADSPAGPSARFLATIEIDQEIWPLTISSPDTVESGVAFVVTVNSYYNDDCEEGGPTEVSVEAGIAHVVPFDQRTEAPNCPDAGVGVAVHEGAVVFDDPGDATVRVLGRSNLTPNANDTLTVDLPVVVR